MAYPFGEAAHLWVTTLLTGVASKGVWQSSYLLERFKEAMTRRVAAHWALDPILVTTGSQLARFTAGADDRASSGS